MGMVKRLIEDVTYDILDSCSLEDTQENYDKVFQWTMDSDLQIGTEALINKYKTEHPQKEAV